MIPIVYDAAATNFNNQGLGMLRDVETAIVTEERNGIYELEITYPVGGVNAEYLVNFNYIKVKVDDDKDLQLFRIGNVTKSDSNYTISVIAHHITYDLNGLYVSPLILFNADCNAAMESIFENVDSSSFSGSSDLLTKRAQFAMGNQSAMNCIAGTRGSLLDLWGGEIIRDNWHIRLVKSRGQDNGVTLRGASDITGLTINVDTTDLVTEIVPYYIDQENKIDGEDLVHMLPEVSIKSPLYNDYPVKRTLGVDYTGDEAVNSIDTLRTKAKTWFDNNERDKPKISMDVNFIALWQYQGYEFLRDLRRLRLCDTTRVYHDALGVSVTVKVTTTVYDVLQERYTLMKLGTPRATFDMDMFNQIDTVKRIFGR